MAKKSQPQRRRLVLCIELCLAFGPCLALAGQEEGSGGPQHRKAVELQKEGKIVALESILEHLKSIKSGRIIEVEFEEENQTYLYAIEWLDDAGKVWEFEVDARTGHLLELNQEGH